MNMLRWIIWIVTLMVGSFIILFRGLYLFTGPDTGILLAGLISLGAFLFTWIYGIYNFDKLGQKGLVLAVLLFFGVFPPVVTSGKHAKEAAFSVSLAASMVILNCITWRSIRRS